MTAAQFRKIALGFPGAIEKAHMNHPDFRVAEGGKIFATLGPDENRAMVQLSPVEQSWFIRSEPKVFSPASGAWGLRGSTVVSLRDAKVAGMKEALAAAFEGVASRKQ